jgi:hypothetical protein
MNANMIRLPYPLPTHSEIIHADGAYWFVVSPSIYITIPQAVKTYRLANERDRVTAHPKDVRLQTSFCHFNRIVLTVIRRWIRMSC